MFGQHLTGGEKKRGIVQKAGALLQRGLWKGGHFTVERGNGVEGGTIAWKKSCVERMMGEMGGLQI